MLRGMIKMDDNYYRDIVKTYTSAYKTGYNDGIHFVLDLLNDEKIERILKNGYLPSEWLSEH